MLFQPLLRNKGHEKSGVPVLPVLEVRNAACAVQYSICCGLILMFAAFCGYRRKSLEAYQSPFRYK